MKSFFKILILSIVFIGPMAHSAVTNIDQIMNTIDEKNITSMEQLLPELPYELRSNYTLVYQSRSRQQGSLQKPRVIMFGTDGKFLTAFNGDANALGFDKLEMIQFNDAKKKFEFFELEFPIKRDLNGRAIRPENTPAVCMSCHGMNPHPIWNSYNNWPGVFGSGDDFVEGAELPALEAFVNSRRNLNRYQSLSPLQGSEIAPYSYEKRGNFKFRPNLRFGSFLSRLQALQLAERIKAGGAFDQYASLLAYELDRGFIVGPDFLECPSLTTSKAIFDGQWTPQDAKNLHTKLEAERARVAPQSPPIPEKWHVTNHLHPLYLPNSTPGDWSLFLETLDLKTAEFQNGNGGISFHVLSALKEELFRVIPETKALLSERSRFVEDTPNQRLVRTPFDFEYNRTLDEINMRVGFRTLERCEMLMKRIKTDWAL